MCGMVDMCGDDWDGAGVMVSAMVDRCGGEWDGGQVRW